MTDRPILFSAPMVRAIQARRKTQTRRVVKGQALSVLEAGFTPAFAADEGNRTWCPYGRDGDLLWVRESHWRYTGLLHNGGAPPDFVPAPSGDPYQARCYDDNPDLDGMRAAGTVVRVPSIHMPRWASRITLEVERVRVERLQDITEADAEAEGAPFEPGGNEELGVGYRIGFAALWDGLNAARGHGWDTNPWVWVVTFQVALAPADE